MKRKHRIEKLIRWHLSALMSIVVGKERLFGWGEIVGFYFMLGIVMGMMYLAS